MPFDWPIARCDPMLGFRGGMRSIRGRASAVAMCAGLNVRQWDFSGWGFGNTLRPPDWAGWPPAFEELPPAAAWLTACGLPALSRCAEAERGQPRAGGPRG